MLSEEERTALAVRNKPAVEAIVDRLQSETAARRGPPPQVVQAMENLVTAVRLRLRGRTADEIQIHAVAAASNVAAQRPRNGRPPDGGDAGS
jgi:hypothetical protein